jgi:hypothetical protein
MVKVQLGLDQGVPCIPPPLGVVVNHMLVEKVTVIVLTRSARPSFQSDPEEVLWPILGA